MLSLVYSILSALLTAPFLLTYAGLVVLTLMSLGTGIAFAFYSVFWLIAGNADQPKQTISHLDFAESNEKHYERRDLDSDFNMTSFN